MGKLPIQPSNSRVLGLLGGLIAAILVSAIIDYQSFKNGKIRSAEAYFGGSPFGECKFGVDPFGVGAFGENSCSDVAEALVPEFLLLPDDTTGLLQPDTTGTFGIQIN